MALRDCAISSDPMAHRAAQIANLTRIQADEFPPQLREEWQAIGRMFEGDGMPSEFPASLRLSDADAEQLISRIADIAREMMKWEAVNSELLHGNLTRNNPK